MNWISYVFCFLMVGCLAVYVFTKTEYIQLAWAAIGTGLAFCASHPNAGVGQPAAGIIETLGVIVFAWCLGTTIKQCVLKRKKQRDCVDSTADVVEVVRCKNCGNYCKNTGECNKYGHHPGEDGYCSGAIPKECEL